jgi:hypothetical protein
MLRFLKSPAQAENPSENTAISTQFLLKSEKRFAKAAP